MCVRAVSQVGGQLLRRGKQKVSMEEAVDFRREEGAYGEPSSETRCGGAVRGPGVLPLLWALRQVRGVVQGAADCLLTSETLRGDISGSGLIGVRFVF